MLDFNVYFKKLINWSDIYGSDFKPNLLGLGGKFKFVV